MYMRAFTSTLRLVCLAALLNIAGTLVVHHRSATLAGSGLMARAWQPLHAVQLQPAQPVAVFRGRAGDIRMGVPKFFRWLTEKYPQINVKISEGRRRSDYVDNFYLDMNGIIHQCTHGDEVGPNEKLSEEQMFERIFAYTDRLISIARPRKVLYLAIDGVAPRAKMNQQRSRRYRVPRELAQQALRDKANAKARFRQAGDAPTTGQPLGSQRPPPPPEVDTFGGPPPPPPFDSNCITPGTDFLHRLGGKYEEWIAHKMTTDPAWRDGPRVVFSGAAVPGEGKHKTTDWISHYLLISPPISP